MVWTHESCSFQLDCYLGVAKTSRRGFVLLASNIDNILISKYFSPSAGNYYGVFGPMNESRIAGTTSPHPADSATTAPAPGTADRNPGRRAADRIVGSSSATQHAAEQASAAARLSGPVGLVGASGSGKTHFARAIHAWSARAANPFVVVTAAAIPAANQTEEIFGPSGAFAQAGEGTILIRDISSLTDSVRIAVLRAVEEGAHDGAPVRARILESADSEVALPVTGPGSRWSVLTIAPLSKRREDIPALAAQFLASCAEEQGIQAIGFTAEARRWMVDEEWEGNVRELRERVRQAFRLAGNGAISIEALMLSNEGDDIPSFKEAKRAFETRYVESLLRRCSGNISRAARLAKKDRKDFYDVIRRTGVNPQQFRS
ncbi:MAG: sigma 54-interacting transcriptional regulator [Myxococcota bacterium]|nr:sigma 54-interacting transcriptional regulator [Myxococcota bacterium]